MTLLWYQKCSIRAVTQPINCSHLAFGDKVISFRKGSTNDVKIPMFRDLESEELESSSVPSSYQPVIYSVWVYHVFFCRRWGSRTHCSLTSLLALLFNQWIIYLKPTLYVTSSRFWLFGGWDWVYLESFPVSSPKCVWYASCKTLTYRWLYPVKVLITRKV